MKLSFIKVNPTENMTVFILDQIPRSMYVETATKIMAYGNIYAEQVGFLENISSEDSEACVRLHMMGGEFCANATLALSSVLVQRNHYKIQKKGEKFIVPLEVSGSDEIINCEVQSINTTSFVSTAKMPLHKSIKDVFIEYRNSIYEGTLVEFSGIVHLVINSNGIDSKEEFFSIVKEQLNDLNYDALGIMYYNEENSYMEPLVYVKSTESLIFERGCGSGTTALGIVFSHRFQKDIDMIVKQPGGQLEVTTHWDENKINSVYLKGIVHIVAEGISYI